MFLTAYSSYKIQLFQKIIIKLAAAQSYLAVEHLLADLPA